MRGGRVPLAVLLLAAAGCVLPHLDGFHCERDRDCATGNVCQDGLCAAPGETCGPALRSCTDGGWVGGLDAATHLPDATAPDARQTSSSDQGARSSSGAGRTSSLDGPSSSSPSSSAGPSSDPSASSGPASSSSMLLESSSSPAASSSSSPSSSAGPSSHPSASSGPASSSSMPLESSSSPVASSSDAPSSTATSLEPDAGTLDAGFPPCQRTVLVTYAGDPVDAPLPVLLRLPLPWPGMAPGATNLVVRDAAGTPLPHFVEGVTLSEAQVWVRLPSLGPQPATLWVSACDDHGQPQDPATVFDYTYLPSPEEMERWVETCTRDPSTETCTANPGSGEDSTLRLLAHASCRVTPYDGLHYLAQREVHLGHGSYVLEARFSLLGRHHDFCNGTTASSASFHLDDIVLAQEQCGLQLCRTCSPSATALQFRFQPTAPTTTLRVRALAGDCAESTAVVEDLRIRRVGSEDPVVTLP